MMKVIGTGIEAVNMLYAAVHPSMGKGVLHGAKVLPAKKMRQVGADADSAKDVLKESPLLGAVVMVVEGG